MANCNQDWEEQPLLLCLYFYQHHHPSDWLCQCSSCHMVVHKIHVSFPRCFRVDIFCFLCGWSESLDRFPLMSELWMMWSGIKYAKIYRYICHFWRLSLTPMWLRICMYSLILYLSLACPIILAPQVLNVIIGQTAELSWEILDERLSSFLIRYTNLYINQLLSTPQDKDVVSVIYLFLVFYS